MVKNFFTDLFNDTLFIDGGHGLLPEQITEVVSGGAPGVDMLGEQWAREEIVTHGWHKPSYPVTRFPADWNQYGRAAGPMRNKQMAEYADILVAYWNEDTRGTLNMIKQMEDLGKRVIKVYAKYGDEHEKSN